MKVQVISAKVSLPIYKDGTYLKTRYVSREDGAVEIEDNLAKRLIAKNIVKEVGQKVKPAPIKAEKHVKPKKAEKLEVEDDLPPGAKPISRKG